MEENPTNIKLKMSNSVEREIEETLLRQPVDLHVLRSLSRRHGGFQNNRLRVRVWPKLLSVNRYAIDDFRVYIHKHRDENQVRCDVERSLWSFEPMCYWKDCYRERRRCALFEIIVAIICRNKDLYYYQVLLIDFRVF